MILGKYQDTILARNQPVSFEWCHLLLLPGPFWYLVSKSFHDLLVIIHIQRLWRCITMKICKIHWKLMIFKSQNCFANISATKAPIFMKFETYIHKIVKNYQRKILKDPCKTILTFKNDQFSMYFAYFHILHLQSLQRCLIT